MFFDAEYFARTLKVKRAERGWSQSDLAEKSKVALNAIARYESEANAPTFETVCKLADALDCSLDDFAAATA